MAIPQEYIAELSRRVEITELVGSYVQLKRAGRLERGLCPFHNEKSPSFYVYPDTASFYCFGCGAGGDAITFVKRIMNLDYVEAVRFLAARCGMPMPDEDDDTAKMRGRVLAINRETARFYAAQLNADVGKEARTYLRGRGLTDATIRRFGLGFAPEGFGALRDHLKRQGYAEKELVEAGVCKVGKNNSVYDAFFGRVMFPIIDLRGNVVAFGGRSMQSGKGAKYLNTGDTPVFKKSRNLFALNFAKKSNLRRFILAEGYMDVISLHQAGFDTAVATLGTALTGEQARLISDYADEVVICYDADEAGQKATARAIGILKETPVKVTVLNVPDAKDPDEFIRKFGPERFEQLLVGSGNVIEYELAKAKRGFDLTTDDGKASYIRAALDILAAEAMPAEQNIYAGRVASETDVDKAALLAQLEGVVKRRRRKMAQAREKKMLEGGLAGTVQVPYTAGGRALGVAFAEQQLVAALLKNPGDCLPLCRGQVRAEQFINPEMGEAYAAIVGLADDEAYIDLAALTPLLPEKTIALLGRVLAQNHETGFAKEDVEMFIRRILDGGAKPDAPGALEGDAYRDYIASLKDRKG